jgi:hypothetical protein
MKTKISFDSQSKSVTASVEIEKEGESNDEVLAEAKRLFNLAEEYALKKSMERNR